MERRGLFVRLALMAAALAAVLWGFQALLLRHAPMFFNDPKEDMTFGWYVPLFSLYVLWSERKAIAASAGAPGWGGLLLMVPFLLLGFLGVRGIQMRFEVVAFAGLLVALAWAFFGRRTAKAVLFPALFLLFCIPLATFLDVVTVHLRLLASSTAYVVLKGFGADVVRQGTMIGAADGAFSIDVAEPCSGLRSIFALMALTAAYAYYNQPTWLRRGLLFAASVPLAILGNVFRILSICLVANYADKDFATGFYHDYSGYVVFVVAIGLMIATGEAINRLAGRVGKEVKGEELDVKGDGQVVADPASRASRSSRFTLHASLLAVPLVALAVTVTAMVYQAAMPKVTVAPPPDVHLDEVAGYSWSELAPSEAELKILPADTRIEKRLYTTANGDWFQVSLVVGGASKASIHRPELCLPAQGYLMTKPRTLAVDGVAWRALTVEESGGGRIGFAYTFFNQEGFRTASHTRRIFRDMWDRSFLNRIDRWVMVTVNASRADDDSLTAFLRELKGVVAP